MATCSVFASKSVKFSFIASIFKRITVLEDWERVRRLIFIIIDPALVHFVFRKDLLFRATLRAKEKISILEVLLFFLRRFL